MNNKNKPLDINSGSAGMSKVEAFKRIAAYAKNLPPVFEIKSSEILTAPGLAALKEAMAKNYTVAIDVGAGGDVMEGGRVMQEIEKCFAENRGSKSVLVTTSSQETLSASDVRYSPKKKTVFPKNK